MQNTYQEKILDLETTNNTPRIKLEGGIKFKINLTPNLWSTAPSCQLGVLGSQVSSFHE